MLLAIDIGNTNVSIGLFHGRQLESTWRISTDNPKTADEYGILLTQIITMHGNTLSDISMASICSVVPPLTSTFETLCQKYLDINPLVIGSGTKTGIKVLYDSPRDVGSDRIVDAAAANHLYGGPCIVVDLGTATVFDAINDNSEYLGGAISPGLTIAADSLYNSTSQLKRVELIAPSVAIGRNTTHSIQSGLILGYSDLISGMILRFKKELGENSKVIATGGLAKILKSEVNLFDVIDVDLTLKGLQIIFDMNHTGLNK
jgi:type III pantothenate kinase